MNILMVEGFQWAFGISSVLGFLLSIASLILSILVFQNTQTTKKYIRDKKLIDKLTANGNKDIKSLVNFASKMEDVSQIDMYRGLLLRQLLSMNHYNELLSPEHYEHNQIVIKYCYATILKDDEVIEMKSHLNASIGLYLSVLHEETDIDFDFLGKDGQNEN